MIVYLFVWDYEAANYKERFADDSACFASVLYWRDFCISYIFGWKVYESLEYFAFGFFF